jgi:hypothetical protein
VNVKLLKTIPSFPAFHKGTISRRGAGRSPAFVPRFKSSSGPSSGTTPRKGVFLTTSTFTKEALVYAAKVESKVVVTDGRCLLDLMIDFDLGVTTTATYEVKRADSRFFEEGWVGLCETLRAAPRRQGCPRARRTGP